MEGIGRGEFEPNEEDPRTIFADKLRDFFMFAIEQQRVADASEQRTKPAGSLYKTDGGFLKIHLQAPAQDVVFGGTRGQEKTPMPNHRPPIWLLVPLGSSREEGFELEDVMLSAESLTVHVMNENGESVQFLVRDDYVGPVAPIYETLEDLAAHAPPDEIDQLSAALYWVEMLADYSIRTITSSRIDAA